LAAGLWGAGISGLTIHKKMKANGYLLHEGVTRNGAPFVAIATLSTSNRKTGDMVQVWFLLRDVNPVQGVKEAIDAATVCEGCPFASGNGCYVNVGQAPLSIWKAYKRGAYGYLAPKDYAEVFGGRKVRFGAYGNPSLLPLSIVKAIARDRTGKPTPWLRNTRDFLWPQRKQSLHASKQRVSGFAISMSRPLSLTVQWSALLRPRG
jgi:hypothetical protein